MPWLRASVATGKQNIEQDFCKKDLGKLYFLR